MPKTSLNNGFNRERKIDSIRGVREKDTVHHSVSLAHTAFNIRMTYKWGTGTWYNGLGHNGKWYNRIRYNGGK